MTNEDEIARTAEWMAKFENNARKLENGRKLKWEVWNLLWRK